MYNNLAKYYDALLKDDQATTMWLEFFNKHKHPGKTLELAAGTGEITLKIAEQDKIIATDLSQDMINELNAKATSENLLDAFAMDMINFSIDDKFDNIICFCDSINYVLEVDDLKLMFQQVYKHLNAGGKFLFDMHSLDRLEEFAEDYIETGQLLDTDYQWSIWAEDDYIHHHFAFYEDTLYEERHVQRVYHYELVKELLEAIGFKLSVYTDFNQVGINAGEKLFIVGEKI
ncbi:MAG: class I SAM-dependent methyltransferase [Erysipelothrix sp.]|nr:class I SAM-dependent methyltransferase [Erysipelothrix sp.]